MLRVKYIHIINKIYHIVSTSKKLLKLKVTFKLIIVGKLWVYKVRWDNKMVFYLTIYAFRVVKKLKFSGSKAATIIGYRVNCLATHCE